MKRQWDETFRSLDQEWIEYSISTVICRGVVTRKVAPPPSHSFKDEEKLGGVTS
jgi:hypothetical protein